MRPGPIYVAEHFVKNVTINKIIPTTSTSQINRNSPNNTLKYIVWGSLATGVLYVGLYYYNKNMIYKKIKENPSIIKQYRLYGN